MTEDIDCDIIIMQEMIFVNKDDPDGSTKGRHKLVAICFSVKLDKPK